MRDDLATETSGRMPDAFDRQLAMLVDLPDVVKTHPSTVQVVPSLGIGGVQTFVVQTVRQAERGDTIFLQVFDGQGATRLVLPAVVTTLIARQRDALTTKRRSRASRAVAADRKARGIPPAFLGKGRGKKKRAGS